ncbi:hypothetical protein [Saccharothrix lopnurensis]|uniref:Uncharacterized protein n=1 Tax=Saccharothrix lopnurensis TaxID=1670621 RepID=A0ABW1P8Q3_9PSEU
MAQHEQSAFFTAWLRSNTAGTDSNLRVTLYSKDTITRPYSQDGGTLAYQRR